MRESLDANRRAQRALDDWYAAKRRDSQTCEERVRSS
jgi:hypothetical protein